MKTLHKLFFKKYWISWLKMFGVGFILIIGMVLSTVLDLQIISNLFVFLSFLYITFAPVAHAVFYNNDFQANLDWLINFQYSRRELVKYFLILQTSKFFLMVISYIILWAPLLLITKDTDKKSHALGQTMRAFGVENTILSWGEIGTYYILFTFLIFALYSGSLFKSNYEQIRRQEIKKDTTRLNFNIKTILNHKSLKKNPFLLVPILYLFLNTYLNFFTISVLMAMGVGFVMVIIFNRRFKVFNLQKQYTLASVLALIFTIPHFIAFWGATQEVQNKRVHYNARLTSLDYLSNMVDISPQVFEDISLQINSCEEGSRLARLSNSNQISPTTILHPKIEYCFLRSVIRSYSKHKSKTPYLSILYKRSKLYIQQNELSVEKQLELAKDFSRFYRINQQEIITLFDEKSSFSTAIAYNMAHKYLKPNQFQTLIKTYHQNFPRQLLEESAVKRAIASSPDQVRNQHPILDNADKLIEDL